MDVPTFVSRTNEEDDVDIEGDDDDDVINIVNDITKETNCDTSDQSYDVNEQRYDVTHEQDGKRKVQEDSDFIFKRNKIKTEGKKKISNSDENISSWWSSVKSSKEKTLQDPGGEKQKEEEEEKESALIQSSSFIQDSVNELHPLELISPPKTEESEISFVEDFIPPSAEVELLLDKVTDDERSSFPEFFNGKTKYTLEKYLMIRNATLQLWQKQKPSYVNKVALRPILGKRGCGNVNNIGRIHKYLESIGAINFGCSSVWWKRKRKNRNSKKEKKKESEDGENMELRIELKTALDQRLSARRHKKPVEKISKSQQKNVIGGYTIDHANNNAIILPAALATTKTKSNKQQSKGKTTSHKYKLINCKHYDVTEDCPYDVTIAAASLVVMDTHSHLSNNEVMGLLGGYVTFTGYKVKVQVVVAQPCKSAGSTRHCEMDPVSQSMVCEYITTRGLHVVGWYHSHPTFAPQPSQTDIKTQLSQQMMFNSHSSVFLGIILSPYLRHSFKTQISLVHISDKIDPSTNVEIPFQIPFKVDCDTLDGSKESELFHFLSSMVETARNEAISGGNSSRLQQFLDPVIQGSSITHLDKLIKSLKSYITSQLYDNTAGTDVGKRITTSQTEHDDTMIQCCTEIDDVTTDVNTYCDETIDFYLINGNLPSLSDDNISIDDEIWETPSSESDCDETNVNVLNCDVNETATSSWENVFERIKYLLVNAAETV